MDITLCCTTNPIIIGNKAKTVWRPVTSTVKKNISLRNAPSPLSLTLQVTLN